MKFALPLTFLLAAIFPAVLVSSSSCALDDTSKTDCGFDGVTESSCEAAGCCWKESETYGVPWCYYATSTPGYELSGMVETTTGMAATLTLIGDGNNNYGADIKKLNLDVIYETSDIVRVKITDASQARWEIPETVIPRYHTSSKPESLNYALSYTSSPFSFKVTHNDGRVLFALDASNFVYKNQYIEVSTSVTSGAKTFGLGESTRLNQALKTGKTYTLWAQDLAALVMDENLYGSFPFYVQMVNGMAHGAMLFNSNGMDIVLEETSLSFRTIGGIVDLYVFAGSSPADVVAQYTQIIGRPMMVPYWSLGFHNCKYGYESLAQVEQVVANYSVAGIPLDTQWMDIDYMQDYRDFTYGSENFPVADVATFVSQLHKNGQHFVPIVDPGIMVYDNYDAYEQGLKQGIFVKDLQGNYYLGQVWPGPTYFPDFLHPSTQDYWTDQLQAFYDMVPMDGLWIDMNEVSNFCNVDGTGQVCVNSAPDGCPADGASQTDCCLVCSTVDADNALDFPPYAISSSYGNLGTKTMAPSATHYNNITSYDAHNLYGLTEQIATNQALRDIRKKRPFLLTRSSFISSGTHTAKWTGDNGATWNDLKSSIISLMDFNMFGVPMIGADICGFIYDTTEELCARWIEVGAFYPFSRDHNAIGQAPQELYLWDSVTEAAKNALGMRYQMLPYMYTLFYQANTAGAMVVRSLWVNFPSDPYVLTNTDGQFMLGDAILITPVLTQGATSVNGYFPKGYWYNFAERKFFIGSTTGGVSMVLSTPLTSVNVHMRGGSILPLQESAMTTTAGRQTPFTLLAALCPGGKAFGSLFWDDGEQISLDKYLSASYVVEMSETSGGAFTATIDHDSIDEASNNVIQTITVMNGSAFTPTVAILNGKTLDSKQIVVDNSKYSVTFQGLSLKLNEPFTLLWKF